MGSRSSLQTDRARPPDLPQTSACRARLYLQVHRALQNVFRRHALWCTVVVVRKRAFAPALSRILLNGFRTDSNSSQKTRGFSESPRNLTITDNRTGKSYEVPITHGAIRAADLRQIK